MDKNIEFFLNNIKKILKKEKRFFFNNSKKSDIFSLSEVFCIYSDYIKNDEINIEIKNDINELENNIIINKKRIKLNYDFNSRDLKIFFLDADSKDIIYQTTIPYCFFVGLCIPDENGLLDFVESIPLDDLYLKKRIISLGERFKFIRYIDKLDDINIIYSKLTPFSCYNFKISFSFSFNTITPICVKLYLDDNDKGQYILLFYNINGELLCGYYNSSLYNDVEIDITNKYFLNLINELFNSLFISKDKLPAFFIEYLENETKNRKTLEEENYQQLYALIEKNNKEINKLIEENQRLCSLLGRRKPITHDMLFEKKYEDNIEYYVIKSEYINNLKEYDLSKISFDNVFIKGVDFRDTNINAFLLDLQKVHNKDASECNFSVNENNSKNYIFDYNTDFTGVKLFGTKMNNPHPCLLNSSIYNAYIDKETLLPNFYTNSLESIDSRGHIKTKHYFNSN